MSKADKLIEKARKGSSLRFSELISIIKSMGYEHARTKGSHQVFTYEGRPMINLQDTSGQAKPYQVRQILTILDNE